MRKQFIAWIVAAVMIAGLLSYAVAQHSGHTVELKNAQGESIGTATLSPINRKGGVRIKLDLKNLPAGEYEVVATLRTETGTAKVVRDRFQVLSGHGDTQ